MKQKDLAVLIVVAAVSAVMSLFLSNMFFSSPKNRAQKVETVDVITADFPSPNKSYFNNESVNPAQLVQIGPSDNQNPFNKTQ
jgi:hypothetical protein